MAAFRFFSGKGGVGKTSCAAATAIREAEAGRDVLVVSMDPAHSLGDALDIALGPVPREVAIRGTRGRLRAVELDSDAALDRWIDERKDLLRTIASRGTYLDDDDLDRFFRLSLPGVDELIGLVELERVTEDLGPELVVVDTAPTGHTLRMLEMPATLRQIATVLDDMQEKHRVIKGALTAGSYRDDRADELIDEVEGQARRVAERLRDPRMTTLSWVCLPQSLSVEETEDGLRGLRALGVSVAEIVVNRVSPAPPRACALCDGRRSAEREAVALLRARHDVPIRLVPRVDREPRGVPALRALGASLAGDPKRDPRSLDLLLDARARPPERARRLTVAPGARVRFERPAGMRIVLFGGKGGVGKTTSAAAAAIAIAEADPTLRVLVLSTDPAHSLGDVLDLPLSDTPRRVTGARGHLEARELDAPGELERRRDQYSRAVDDLFDTLRGGSRLDPTYDRTIIHDLVALAPPGIDELFASIALLDAVHPGAVPHGRGHAPLPDYDLVVVDTAPWGHTERLLQLPANAREWVKTLLTILLKYKGVVGLGSLAEDLLALSRALGRLVETWRDPQACVFVPVTRAAALPRLETMRLLGSLGRMGVRVPSIVVNAVRDPGWELCGRCEGARSREAREIALLRAGLGAASRPGGPAIVSAPILAAPPRGAEALLEWSRAWKVVG